MRRRCKKFPTVAPPPNNNWNGYRGYIMQAVLNELQNTYHYSVQKINTGGLHVVTTVNKSLMNTLYGTVRRPSSLMRHCTPPALLAAAAPATVHGAAEVGPRRSGARAGEDRRHPGHVQRAELQQETRQYDNALQSRNQVGSSFKTYVLATAVSQGMNVQT